MTSRQLAGYFALMAKHGVTELDIEGVRIVRPASGPAPQRAHAREKPERQEKREPLEKLLQQDASVADRIRGMS